MAKAMMAACALAMYLVSVAPVTADPGNADYQRWVRQLGTSRKAAERVEAAERLGRQGFAEAAAPLAGALSDMDREVRRAAASALWALGDKAAPARDALLGALNDTDLDLVVTASGALEGLGTDPAELAPARRRGLAAEDLRIRFMAARGLIGHEAGATLAPHLLDYLVRQAERSANESLEYRSRDAARTAVRSAERALQRLAATQDRSALDAMVRQAGTDHPAQASVLEALGGYSPAPDGWDDLLARGMGSRTETAQRAALQLAMKRTEPDQAARWVPAAGRLAGDTSESVRNLAVMALGRAGGAAAPAVPTLVERLAKEQDAGTRELIARSLGEVGERTQPVPQSVKDEVATLAAPALKQAMERDGVSAVRRAALVSYNDLDLPAEEAVAALAWVAQTSMDNELTWQALQALRNRGVEAAPALAVIQELRGHRDPQLAEYATTIARELEADMADRTRRPAAVPAPAAAAATRPAAGTPRRPDATTEAQGLAVLRQRGAEFSESAFMQALMAADAELVEAFLDAGMDASHRFEQMNGRQPLHLLFFGGAACSTGVRPTPPATRAILDLLLARGAGVNDGDQMGITPLMFAADKCDHPTMSALVAAGASPDARSAMGMSALEMAIWSGNDGLQALIDAGARLKSDTAAAYREAYKDNPAALELIRKASAK